MQLHPFRVRRLGYQAATGGSSVEHTRLLWRLRARSARTGRVLAIRESLAPSCNLKSARWRCVASLRVTLCIDMRRFRLRVLATLLRRSDCSLTRASTPEQTRIRQVAAERFPSSTHDSRPLARWSLRVDTERANCFPLMPAVWRAGWQQGDPSGVASVGIVGVASPCLARACRWRASVRVRVTDQNKLCLLQRPTPFSDERSHR